MTKNQQAKLPPLDSDEETERAYRTLRACRKLIEKAALPDEWKSWIGESIAKRIREETKQEPEPKE